MNAFSLLTNDLMVLLLVVPLGILQGYLIWIASNDKKTSSENPNKENSEKVSKEHPVKAALIVNDWKQSSLEIEDKIIAVTIVTAIENEAILVFPVNDKNLVLVVQAETNEKGNGVAKTMYFLFD